MSARASILPLYLIARNRSLAGGLSVVAFVTTMVIAGLTGDAAKLESWRGAMDGRLTVLLSPDGTNANGPAMEDALAVLNGFSGIARAKSLSRAEVADLVAPWIGSRADVDALPLPAVIDITIAPGKTVDLEALRTQFAALGGGVKIDDHGSWLSQRGDNGTAPYLAVGAVFLAVGTTIFVVMLVVRGSLATHRTSLVTLHWLGASDRFIARQFQNQVGSQGLIGSLLGLTLALSCLAGVKFMSAVWDVPDAILTLKAFAAMVTVSVVIPGISVITARMTVSRALVRMP